MSERSFRDAPRAPIDRRALDRARSRHVGVGAGALEAALLSLAVDETGPVLVATPGASRRVGFPPHHDGTLADWLAAGGELAGVDEHATCAVLVEGASDSVRAPLVWDVAEGALFGLDRAFEDVRRVADRLASALHGASAEPSPLLATLRAPPPHERRQLLAWGTGPTRRVPPGTAADDVRAHALRAPNALALVAGAEHLSYAALDARIDAMAAALASRGVARGSAVGVALDRSATWVVTMLALFRLGATYVPIDLAYPAERIDYMLADSGAELLVHGDRSVSAQYAGARWNVEADPPQASSPAPAPAPAADLDDDIAYVIYTSGSTGRPKGVEVCHGPLRNTIAAKVALLAMDEGDVQVAVMSAAFDASIFELTMPLLAGGTLVVATRAELEDFHALGALLTRHEPTVMGATPPTWRGLLDGGWRPTVALRAMVGGEALPSDLARRLARFCRVFNIYGLTETAISSTFYEVDGQPMGASAPIGRPLANCMTRVVTATRELARIGELGELAVGGIGVARGYRGAPELTAARFVVDPIGATQERFFMTGDQARMRADGQIEFFGRLDTQVKIRGMRIELGEIEVALAEADDVNAVVVAARDVDGVEQLVAYVVGRDRDVDLTAMRARARERLAPHMVPAAYVRLDALPLTPNGKIDRRALPAPPRELGSSAAALEDHDPLSAATLAAVGRVAGASVDRSTSFLGLGLDSIARARLKHALAQEGLEVSFVDLLTHDTIADLIASLRSRGAQVKHGAPPVARRAAAPRPVVANQKFPMLTHLTNPGTGAWNCQIGLALGGDVDIAVLERAWRAVVERHGALRLRFRWRGLDYPLQEIVDDAPAPWELASLPQSGPDYANALRRLQADELRTTFEMESPPLHRFVAARAPDGTLDVLWTYFSGLLDGWSSAIVIRDLIRAYDALCHGEAPWESPAPFYFDHLDRMAARDWSSSVAFFARALAGYTLPKSIGAPPGGDEVARSVETLPADLRALFEALRDKPFRTLGVGSLMTRLTASDSLALTHAAARFAVPVSTLMQAAWAITLMREYRCRDMLVGMVAANRPDYEAAVGKYTCLMPFRYTLERATPLGDWLRHNERFVLDVLAHEGIPSHLWVAALGLEPWHFPFEATFTFVNYASTGSTPAMRSGIRVSASRQVDAGIPPAFGMVVIPGESFMVRLEYNRAGGYDEAQLVAMLDGYVELVRAIVAADDDVDVASWIDGTFGARAGGVPLQLV